MSGSESDPTDRADAWRRTKQVLANALERSPDERAAFLDNVCSADPALRADVESLLAAHTASGSFAGHTPLQAFAERENTAPDDVAGGAWRLQPGDRLGPYQIEAPLGSGGMGEVYKAIDTRLNRAVALKILPDIFHGDPRIEQRFEREAKAIAALRHPHICVLHDVGREGDLDFLVMEYLDGESLAQRLAKGPLPFEEVLRYATNLADALAAIHRHGLVHRDVKPANVMLTPNGATLLDFGTARVQRSYGIGDVATEGSTRTSVSTIVGTLNYMAPEQLEGKEVDGRADVFAFGAVVYEMLTGRRAFEGSSHASVVAAILERDPAPPTKLGIVVPSALERLVLKCLRKDPNERRQAEDIVEDLRRLYGRAGRSARLQRVWPGRSRVGWSVASIVVLLVSAALLWRSGLVTNVFTGRRASTVASRVSDTPPIVLGNMRQLTHGEELEIDPSISPDGKFVTYSAGNANQMHVYVRPTAGGQPITVSDAAQQLEYQPRWSPDGTEILYVTGRGVYVAPAFGGTPHRVDAASDSAGPYSGEHLRMGIRATDATWSPDGRQIAVARGAAVIVVARDGSTPPRPLARAPSDLHHCNWSGDGRFIACTSGNWHFAGYGGNFGNAAPSQIVVVPSDGGAVRDVTDLAAQNQSPVWAPDNRHLFFVSNRQGTYDVYSQELSPQARPLGTPTRITTGLGVYSMALSNDKLAYAAYSNRANIFSVLIPKHGTVDVSRARAVTTGNQVVEAMNVSRDGKWLLYDSTLYGNADIFRIPTAGGPVERLTTDPADEYAPDLSPDGRLLAYHSWRTKSRDVFVQPLDGGPIEQVTATPGQEAYPNWFADGRAILFYNFGGADRYEAVRRDESGHWGTPVGLPFLSDTDGLAWLRDGRSIVCAHDNVIWTVSWESHMRRELYRRRNGSDPGVASMRQDLSGDPMYFKSHDEHGITSFWSVPMTGGRPTRLVTFSDPARQSSRFDFAVDATRFYFTIDERRSNIWIADVKER